MSARIREALKTWGKGERLTEAKRATVQPVHPAKPIYSRAFIEAPIGQPGLGVAIDETQFAAADVARSERDPAGYTRHYAYRGGRHVEIVEIPAAEVRAMLAEEGA